MHFGCDTLSSQWLAYNNISVASTYMSKMKEDELTRFHGAIQNPD
jgi:hypothetical protein